MRVHGSDCSIVIKTSYREFDVPYSEETIREAVSFIDDGNSDEIIQKRGVTGCVVTPLTIGTVEHLLYLAFGSTGHLEFVTNTQNLFKCRISLLSIEDTECFDLIQDRKTERRLYENCKVKSFELRFEREQAVKLKIDVCSDLPAVVYNYADLPQRKIEERFFGENVSYFINGNEYKNIYGMTVLCKKENKNITEIWIRRSLEKGGDIPDIIENLTVISKLIKDIYAPSGRAREEIYFSSGHSTAPVYENCYFGEFRLTFEKLVLVSDETYINTSDSIIDPLRFYVSGSVSAEVFSSLENN